MQLVVRRDSCITRGVDSSDRKDFHSTLAMNAYSHGTPKREENRWVRHNRLFKVPFIQKKVGHMETDF